MDFSPNVGALPNHFLNGRAAAPACIDCAGVATPPCPACPSGQTCVQNVQTCTSCVTTSCIATASVSAGTSSGTSPATTSTSNGPNTGAIVGGVLGGLVAIVALVYLTWRFCIKNKRQPYEAEDWVEFQHEPTDAEKDFSFRRDQRASTHTVGSMASTVLTRASNIIQIAYIPGLGTRSNPGTPSLLVPPVPPIPLALAPEHSPAYTEEHFFMPGDIRDSSYSAMTSYTDRTSYAHRSSVASTIYGKGAVVSPVNPQSIVRGKAAVVSVKSVPGPSGGTTPPPVPTIDYDRFGDRGPPSPAFSIGSTFLSNASAATAHKGGPTMIRLTSKLNDVESIRGTDSEASSQMMRDPAAITIIDDTAMSPTKEHHDGPFADPDSPRSARSGRSNSLSAVIEEATKKAISGSGKREESPFADKHATRD